MPEAELKKSGQDTGLGSWMTAWVVGFGGIPVIALFVHWYEVVLFQNPYQQLIVNTLAPFLLFLFFLLAGGLNPLVRRIAPSWALSRRGLFLVLALWLLTGVICFMNGVGPMLHTSGTAMYEISHRPALARSGLQKYLRRELFLPASTAKDYFYGLGDGVKRVTLGQIPWRAWGGILRFWLPALLTAWVLAWALVRMTHRQWSRHELLTYPIAEFAGSLLRRRADRLFPDLFYDRVFWCGFALTAAIYTINGLRLWFPLMIQVPLQFAHYNLIRQFHFLNDFCGTEAYSLFRGMVYPFVIALAVLLPMEVSLTCWLGWVLMILFTGVFFLFTGENIGRGETGYIQTGMYVAMLVMIVFIGRREYFAIFRGAFGLTRGEEKKDPHLRAAVLACRIFIAAFAGLIAFFVYAGLDLLTAFTLVAAFVLILLLIARMTAEIGIPWLVSFGGMASGMPLKLLGAAAMGPKGLAVLAVLASILDFDTTNTWVAQQTTLDKINEEMDEEAPPPQASAGRPPKLSLLLALGVCVAVVCSCFGTLWDNYSFGARRERSMHSTMTHRLKDTSSSINRLTASEGQGTGNQAKTAVNGAKGGMLLRLGRIQAASGFWKYFLLGAVLVGGCAFMRLRFTWWPLHPLPLLLINTWCLSRLYFSFLLGWLIKVALVRIGGGKFFLRSKPFFIGVIFGQVVLAGIWVLIGVVYWAITDRPPPRVIFFI